MKLLIIMPAFNEEKNLENVVKRLRKDIDKSISYDILAVDDGSTDNTREAAKRLGVQVITLCNNLGIGGAVQTGFKYAVENNYDITLQFDSDGQHNASEISKVIKPIIDGRADAVIGSRFLRKGYKGSLHRTIGIFAMGYLLRILMGQRITDVSSGFRALNRRATRYFSQNYPVDYPDAEAILLLHYKGFRIKEVPVKMNRRERGRSSVSFFGSFTYLFKTSVSILAAAIRRK